MMTFDQLRALVRRATGPETSSFYRALYGLPDGAPPRDIADMGEWAALPHFTKEDLVRARLRERAFRSADIDSVLASSGTSGKGVVFSPWSLHDGYRYRLRHHNFPRATISSMPVGPLQEWLHARYAPQSTFIVLDPDPKRCRASVRLAKDTGVESIFTLTPHVPALAAAMVEEGITHDIRFIEIAGEKCSRELYAFLARTFPHAKIFSIYGSSDVETNPIGIPCRALDGTDPLEAYHTQECFYLEIIDSETGAPLPITQGVEGDLLVTADAGEAAAFPLIRYRIGDMVRIVDEQCAEHGSWSFEVLGRTEMDFIKVPGGILRADDIERVLRRFPDEVSDVFELHCRMEDTPRGLALAPVLFVELRRPCALAELAQRISLELKIGPSRSYADGVAEGRFLPLRCEERDATRVAGKRKRIVWR